jgi:hypothetical protein
MSYIQTDMTSEETRLRAQVAGLREALSALYAVQNGSPLPSYEKDWTEAMRLSDKALATVQP